MHSMILQEPRKRHSKEEIFLFAFFITINIYQIYVITLITFKADIWYKPSKQKSNPVFFTPNLVVTHLFHLGYIFQHGSFLPKNTYYFKHRFLHL